MCYSEKYILGNGAWDCIRINFTVHICRYLNHVENTQIKISFTVFAMFMWFPFLSLHDFRNENNDCLSCTSVRLRKIFFLDLNLVRTPNEYVTVCFYDQLEETTNTCSIVLKLTLRINNHFLVSPSHWLRSKSLILERYNRWFIAERNVEVQHAKMNLNCKIKLINHRLYVQDER